MLFSVLFSFSLLSLSLLAPLLGFTWFDFAPTQEDIGNILIGISFTGSIQGILLPIIFLSIHYSKTAKECWRTFYCLFPLFILALLIGWGIQAITQHPMPNVVNLVNGGLLEPTYYQLSREEQHQAMTAALAQSNGLADYLKAEWRQWTGYAMPAFHAIASFTVALYFAALFFRRQQGVTAMLILGWAHACVFIRLLIDMQRPQDLFVGLIIAALCAQLALMYLRSNIKKEDAIRALREKKLAEANAAE
ncbi:phosphatase PAP2 family protein [Motilimonas eburnea]|uniref:phosphatase PAP2 family protein n=1 Tax=Motilimonas eburnea TaxID=1737488 RepID=UPI001E59D210|nr:phosphatase PAP2 family protein [Motilimonas eburnea]MCE2573099.1 phosphatase PAP2 family protein [Motilimonas eburnea]